jgi:hypothetical protein
VSRKETTLQQAHRIADTHGLFFVPVTEGTRRAWVVYRKNPTPGQRAIRVGRRCGASPLLSLVKHAAGIAKEPPRPAEEATAF